MQGLTPFRDSPLAELREGYGPPQRPRTDLPRFGLFVFLVVAVVLIVVPTVLVVVDEVVIIIFVIVIVEFVGFVGVHSCQAVPAVGLAFSRLGGGYVDQKCRPHFGHTQN